MMRKMLLAAALSESDSNDRLRRLNSAASRRVTMWDCQPANHAGEGRTAIWRDHARRQRDV